MEKMHRTKIICTAGPSVASEEKMSELVKNGMSVIRFNCSHGTPSTRLKNLRLVRQVEKKLKKPIGVMVDLQGPKLRVGDLASPLSLESGEVWQLVYNAKSDEDKKIIPHFFKELAAGVSVGDGVFMDDGLISTEVVKKQKDKIWIKIIHGGLLESRKGMNVPFFKGKISAITKKDEEDILWAVQHKVDFIALSFVRRSEDLKKLRQIIAKAKPQRWPLIVAKIEKPEAVECMNDIIGESDAVMIARGDLGIELKPEKVPVVQKQIIEQCRLLKKPVIVATQMLDSMRVHPRPTRAEVSDVASAIYAGTDAVLLTGETSTGKYPIRATSMMNRIIQEVEDHMIEKTYRKMPTDFGLTGYQEAFVFNVMQTADDIDAKAIVILNRRGIMTKVLSKLHPKQPIYSLAMNDMAYRQLNMYWGVFPIEMKSKNTSVRIKVGLDIMKAQHIVQKGDRLLFVYRDFKTDFLNMKIVEV